jgi:GntR family transcriptional regulator
VVKAYRDLETRGLLDSRHGRGTFVKDGVRFERSAAHVVLQRKIRRWVTEAIAEGMTREDVGALFDSTVHELFVEGVA